MAVEFNAPEPGGALRQGEILAEIIEHLVALPCDDLPEIEENPISSITHPHIIVLTQECDLNQDYLARYPNDVNFPDEDSEKKFRDNSKRYLLGHVLVCAGLREGEIKLDEILYEMKSDIFKRVRKNQDERFHHLGPWSISGVADSELDLYFDFKRSFSLPIASLYESVYKNPERRMALTPQLNVQDLSQRYSSFISRVPLPG